MAIIVDRAPCFDAVIIIRIVSRVFTAGNDKSMADDVRTVTVILNWQEPWQSVSSTLTVLSGFAKFHQHEVSSLLKPTI